MQPDTPITANPAIRFLLLCGKESKLFRPGQSLGALVENGMDEARRIVGADGYEPVLRTVTPQRIAAFRRQVELVDWIGERDLETLRVRWSSATQVAMGSAQHFQPGALLRARGTLRLRDEVEAEGIAVLTKVATIQ